MLDAAAAATGGAHAVAALEPALHVIRVAAVLARQAHARQACNERIARNEISMSKSGESAEVQVRPLTALWHSAQRMAKRRQRWQPVLACRWSLRKPRRRQQ